MCIARTIAPGRPLHAEREPLQAARRLFDPGVYVRLAVQALRLFPELRGMLRPPDLFLQQRRPSQGIREIERLRLGVTAVYLEALFVASLRAAVIFGMTINVAQVANGVGEFQGRVD